MIAGIVGCMVAWPHPSNGALGLGAIVLVATWRRLSMRGVGVLVTCFGILALVALLLFSTLNKVKAKANRSNCKGNLKNLGLGVILYRDNQGAGTAYPPRSGADFLVALWDSGVTQEPDLYLCPSSGDDNHEGATLALGRTPPEGCSYAARRNTDQTRYPGVFSQSGMSETPMACDDLEGRDPFNHDDAVIVLFMDGHVEEIQVTDPAIVEEFGRGGLLDPLAN